jgi:hypothetical protein
MFRYNSPAVQTDWESVQYLLHRRRRNTRNRSGFKNQSEQANLESVGKTDHRRGTRMIP